VKDEGDRKMEWNKFEGYPINSKWYWQILWKMEHCRIISLCVLAIVIILTISLTN